MPANYGRWYQNQSYTEMFLKEHPLCAVCSACGYYRKAKHVVDDFDGSRYAVCDDHYLINGSTTFLSEEWKND